MHYSALIVAAGSGSRMQLGYNKVFYRMKDGMSVLEKTVRCFANQPDCVQVVIVTQPQNFELCQFKITQPLILCEGGATRSQSVVNGLKKVSESVVFVHDGARPYVSADCLNRLVKRMETVDACILAVPCKDTIKIAENGRIQGTPDRATLFQAQTPQAFKTEILKQAYQQAALDGSLTDDASCVEKYGMVPVYLEEGDYANLKITTPEDLKDHD